eukprot:Blabericola_migrator_1__6399@NODE_3225_length_1933_cov_182_051447_g2018_i0_p1_GENE_NODE_3225_length_1933_cov_182_051447_g2018_i0NODE_3225_length_1933_cov_182_051447_g2018_i0_p1_ORF_typecomplete_len562_score108_35DUF4139/PF13598_6/5_4e51DUF4140/PF13600_6/6_3e05DUF4140/PF13600_6/1_5e04DBB/PF14545_6/1_4DBB/PF14545_6/21Ribosomal_L1/PF00687_21/0_23Atg14/PF10186_9/0_35Atg14/PF10186_9/1e03_NODE_3225_length_1933_cov_182_051447_g2018_i01561841
MSQVTVNPVKQVKVFRDGVEIQRQVVVKVEQRGTHHVEIELPHSFVKAQSVKVLCQSGVLTIRQIKTRSKVVTVDELAKKNPQLEDLVKQFNECKKEWQRLDAIISLGESRLTALRQYLTLPSPPHDLDLVKVFEDLLKPENIDKAQQMMKQEEASLLDRVEDRVKAIVATEKAWDEICKALDVDVSHRLQSGYCPTGDELDMSAIRRHLKNNYKTHRIVVDMVGDFTATETVLTLVYIANAAHWTPTYEVAFHPETSNLDLVCYASVHQNTGELWENVDLAIFSGSAEKTVTPPELTRRGATLIDPQPSKPTGSETHFGAQSVVVNNDATTVFNIAGKHTIRGDNTQQRVKLAEGTMQTSLQYICIPEMADSVYRAAELVNTVGITLLNGPISILEKSSTVGKTFLQDRVPPGGKFRLFLGEEQKLKVDAKPVAKVSKQLGFVNPSVKDSYTRDLVIRNAHKTPTKVFVILSLPIPETDQIKVTCDQKPAKCKKCPHGFTDDIKAVKDFAEGTEDVLWCWNQTTGHCVAICNLAPQSSAVHCHEYSVEYPKSLAIEIATK